MVSNAMLCSYFEHLVGRVYKILPLYEGGEDTLPEYLDGLLEELIGVEYLDEVGNQPYYMTIVGIVSYLCHDLNVCDARKVKRNVFRAINLCKKLQGQYGGDL